MAIEQPDGRWIPEPTEKDYRVAHRWLDKGYVQVSRAYRHLAPAVDDHHIPFVFRNASVTLTIDEFAAFRRLGGTTRTEVSVIAGDVLFQRCRLHEGAKALRRMLRGLEDL
jgi:hypothetical protein